MVCSPIYPYQSRAGPPVASAPPPSPFLAQKPHLLPSSDSSLAFSSCCASSPLAVERLHDVQAHFRHHGRLRGHLSRLGSNDPCNSSDSSWITRTRVQRANATRSSVPTRKKFPILFPVDYSSSILAGSLFPQKLDLLGSLPSIRAPRSTTTSVWQPLWLQHSSTV